MNKGRWNNVPKICTNSFSYFFAKAKHSNSPVWILLDDSVMRFLIELFLSLYARIFIQALPWGPSPCALRGGGGLKLPGSESSGVSCLDRPCSSERFKGSVLWESQSKWLLLIQSFFHPESFVNVSELSLLVLNGNVLNCKCWTV